MASLLTETARSARSTLAGAYHTGARLLRQTLGAPPRIRSPDRALLERRILPAFGRDDSIQRVLFVGCAPYTQHYPRLLSAAESCTLDPNPRNRRYGVRWHVIAPLQDLRTQQIRGLFDLIVCNGVLGWGLNSPDDADRAMRTCHDALRADGYLVLGWNDVFPRNRVKPEHITALAAFEHVGYAGLPARIRVRSATRHVFDLYRRP